MRGRILIVDDEVATGDLLAGVLQQLGHAAEAFSSARACLERLEHEAADVVVTDVMMPDMSGIQLCEQLRARHPGVVPIVVTAACVTDVAIAAIRAGAYDYLTKPISIRALKEAVARALDELELRCELERLRGTTFDGDLIACSEEMRSTLELARRVVDSDATVLIVGESGAGKEVIAQHIHRSSHRRDEPFVAINCGAMPSSLLESELFGHVRGAFTDAVRERAGLLLQARGGTILLDEVGDMPFEVQAKLLRVLQERSVRPLGSDEEQPLRARVIAATNRNLADDVEARRFREDLFYRLNVIALRVPALRERRADILPLAHMLLQQSAARIGKPVRGMTPSAANLLLDYCWPGNVRELENYMERAVALCKLDQITAGDLPPVVHQIRGDDLTIPGWTGEELVTLGEMRLRYVRRVLALAKGNKSLAARILGIDRRTVAQWRTKQAEVVDDETVQSP